MRLALLLSQLMLVGCIASPIVPMTVTPSMVAAPVAPVTPTPTTYIDAVVEITILRKKGMGTGSAVIFKHVGDTYYAITCNHVAEGQDTILLANNDLCDVLALSPAMDLAVIRFASKKSYSVVGFATPHVDEQVRIVGYRTLKHIRRGSITHFLSFGRISIAGGVYPGYSGGAVFNEHGQIVGITSAVCVFGFSIESDLGIAIRGDVAGRFAAGAMK